MSESARTFSKSTKSANDGECCVGTDAFFLPCEAEVDGLEKSAPPSPACPTCPASWTTSTASSVLAFLLLFVASPPRFLRPPGIIKANDVFSLATIFDINELFRKRLCSLAKLKRKRNMRRYLLRNIKPLSEPDTSDRLAQRSILQAHAT